MIDVRVKQSSS